jgi:hypothetical protein
MMSAAYLLDAAVFVVLQLGSLAVIALSAWVFGETALDRLGLDEPAERRALATALGLGMIAQALFFLGLAGLLERPLVLALLALGHLPCRCVWRRLLSGLRWRLAAPALLVAPSAALALYPPTGFDATVYHLPYVEAFIAAGRLTFAADLVFPVFPQAVEMGFVLAFFLGGEAAAQLTQVLSLGLVAALAAAWGRQLFSARAGRFAAALWLGTPLAVWIAGMAYVDLGLTLYVTAAFHCWERWRRGGDRRWLALAGVFAGLAAGTKYLGLFFCGALFALTAVRVAAFRAGRPWRPLAAFAVAAAVVLAPWYARIVYHTGNPVFPFYPAIFGAGEWTPPRAPTSTAATTLASRAVDGLGFLVRVPWTAVFDREVFHFQAPLTPFYLVLIPLCAPRVLGRAAARRLLLLAGVYGLFWLTMVRDVRFLLPAMPALNVALAGGLDLWTRRWRHRVAVAGIAAVLAAPGLLYGVYKVWERGSLPVTADARADYLSAALPGYDAVRWLNENAGDEYTVYAFGERLRYYADGRFLGNWLGPASFHRVSASLGSGRALHAKLRELGACYFLAPDAWPLPDDAFFAERFRVRWRGSGFTVYETCDP